MDKQKWGDVFWFITIIIAAIFWFIILYELSYLIWPEGELGP